MDIRALEALSDENRFAIVTLLAGGEQCVCDISSALGISNALASHHLKKLREAGIVDTERKGTWLHCSLRRDALLEIAEEITALALREPLSVVGCAAACCPAGCEGTDE
jgi:ArsR family transcriptional regulator, arsenate/arsenite/antimonite-responsive transcriptional repressor